MYRPDLLLALSFVDKPIDDLTKLFGILDIHKPKTLFVLVDVEASDRLGISNLYICWMRKELGRYADAKHTTQHLESEGRNALKCEGVLVKKNPSAIRVTRFHAFVHDAATAQKGRSKRSRSASLSHSTHWPVASFVKFRRTQYPYHNNQHIPEKSGITSPMQSIHPHVNAISDLATGNGNDAPPVSQQSVMLTKQTYIELTWKAHYWQAQHARSVEREAALAAQVAALEATIRDLPQRLYGTKSEKIGRS